MRYAYQPSFLETTSRLSKGQSVKLLNAIQRFQLAIESRQWSHGLGMTHLRGDYFEFRVDIHMRVVYRRAEELVPYALYGTHDQVRRFLKTV